DSMALSAAKHAEVCADVNRSQPVLVLHPHAISNHPEVIRRLGIIGINTALEFDLYGNVNSTHICGTRMINGIGGSGDFSRNAHLAIFVTKSIAKGGAISSVLPMVSHVDHTEHDVDMLVTEQGLAELRGLSPRARAREIHDSCVPTG
ncbi:propionyl-CoA--succinate CoA transferase, partial [Pseudomonas syringae]